MCFGKPGKISLEKVVTGIWVEQYFLQIKEICVKLSLKKFEDALAHLKLPQKQANYLEPN